MNFQQMRIKESGKSVCCPAHLNFPLPQTTLNNGTGSSTVATQEVLSQTKINKHQSYDEDEHRDRFVQRCNSLRSQWGYDQEDVDEVIASYEQGKRLFFIDPDEEEQGLVVGPPILPPPCSIFDTEKEYNCVCSVHPNDQKEDAEKKQGVPTYATVVGKHFTPQGDCYSNAGSVGIIANRYLPLGELRLVNSIIDRPDFYQINEVTPNLDVNNGNLPTEIEKACYNMSAGWRENECWTYKDGKYEKMLGIPSPCGGFSVFDRAVIDAPCFCQMKHYHNTNVVPLDDAAAVMVNSPGYRLAGSEQWNPNIETLKCGFRGRTTVYSVGLNSWVVQAVAMYGCQSFSFTNDALTDLIMQMPKTAERLGGIHPKICEQLATLIISQPNARVLLSKMCRPRKLRRETMVRHATMLMEFVPKDAKRTWTSWPLSGWIRRKMPEYERRESSETTEKQLFKCEICSIFATSSELLQLHYKGKKHLKKVKIIEDQIAANKELENNFIQKNAQLPEVVVDKEFEAQGVVDTSVQWLESAGGVLVDVVNAVLDCEMLDKLYGLCGGRGRMPREDREYLALHLLDMSSITLSTLTRSLVLYTIYKDEVSSVTMKIVMFVSLIAVCYILCTIPKKEFKAQGVPSNIMHAIKVMVPGCMEECDQMKFANELRLAAVARNTLKDYWTFAKFIYTWIVDRIYTYVIETPLDLQKWMDEVDKVEEVIMTEESSSTLRVQLTKFQEHRRHIYQLRKQGIELKKKLESVGQGSFFLNLLNERLKKIERILSQNTGAFVGSQRKFKPHVIYLFGKPKVGKSVMVDHLYSDLFEVMGEEPYVPGKDRHTINPMDEFYDSYQYNRVVDIQDLFQMKNEDARNEELYSLIHMADETPYALKIAECSGKGGVFFCSEHMVLTSNFDLSNQEHAILSLVTSYEAVVRRINVYAEVERDISKNSASFNRDIMSFRVKIGDEYQTMDWYEFVLHCAKSIKMNRETSQGVLNMEKDEIVISRLEALKTKVYETQGISRVDLKTKLHELSEWLRPTPYSRLKAYYNSVCAMAGRGSRTASAFEMARIRFVTSFASYLDKFIDIAVDWMGVIAMLSSICIGYKLGQVVCNTMKDRSEDRKLDEILEADAEGYNDLTAKEQRIWRLWHGMPAYNWKNVNAEDKTLEEIFETNTGSYNELNAKEKRIWRIWHDLEGIPARSGAENDIVHRKKNARRFNHESMAARSGAENEVYARRKGQKRIDINLPEAGPLKLMSAEGCLAPNMSQVRQVSTRNLGRVCGPRVATNCFGLFDRVIAIPEHVVDSVEDDVLRFTMFSNVSFAMKLSDTKHTVLTTHHLIIVDASRWLKNYAPFCDVTRRVWTTKEVASPSGLLVTSRPNMSGGFDCWGIQVEDMQLLRNTAALRMNSGKRYVFSKGLEARGASETGDCGGPWLMDTATNAWIVGLHVGGTDTKEMTAALLTRDLMTHLKEFFLSADDDPVEYQAAGTEYDPPDYVNTIEVCGTTTTSVFQPRKTKIVPSMFQGIIPARTAPAILKPKLVQQEDGTFTKISPLVLNFQKYFFHTSQFSTKDLNAGLELLGDWYFPHGRTREYRRILTLEEAIFGDENDYRNDSMNATSGMGWPWLERFSSRKELFSLDAKTIHPELRRECQRLFDDKECKSSFLFVDMLKDERLPLEKIAAMKTRVFTMLPIHVNIVLKQLFGHFVMYIRERQNECPIKLGISQTPYDWTKLYDFLNIQGSYIAGDYSAFDKGIHFEVMQAICRMANAFYDDDESEFRLKLLRKIFCSYRLIDGVVYKTYGGMASGCYLTASFNSLANTLYWYIFIAHLNKDLDNHMDWFRPATFGDDHVVAVYNRPDVNQVTFSNWLAKYGLKYTTTTKGAIVDEYTPWPEVTFLKRSFRFDGIRWWGPLQLETILDSAQWYKQSATTKGMTERAIAERILEQIELELVHHGKEVYQHWQRILMEKVPYDLTTVARRFETVRNIFLTADSIQYLPHNMNEYQNDYETFSKLSNACAVEITIEPQEFTAQADEIPPAMEQETVLGTDMVEDTVQGLTHFTEQVQSSIAPRPPDLNTPMDDMFELPKDFFKMCYRWLSIGKQAITTGNPTVGPFLRIDPMNFLISDPFIRSKISSTTFIRYNMEIQLKIAATKFHYGAFMVVWRPYYAAGQSTLCYFLYQNLKAEPSYYIRICTPPPSGKRSYSTYDTVYTASQCDHTILSLTAKNTLKIPIPWMCPQQYVPTATMTDPRYHPGFLDIYKITPTGPSDIDSPEFAILAAFTEIRGWGYKAAANQPRPLYYVDTAKGNFESMEKSSWKVPLPVTPSMPSGGDPIGWQLMNGTGKLKIFDAQGIDLVPDTKTEMEEQSSGSWLLDTAHVILNTGKTILSLFTPLGPILGFFGLSRPADATPVTRMVSSALPLSNALGPDVCYSTAMNPYNMLQADNDPGSKLITSLAARPTYLGYFSFSESLMTKKVYSICPMHGLQLGTASDFCVTTPASYIVSKFRFWRSNIVFHIRFFSSSFVSLRVATYITYDDVGGQIGVVPTRVVDINGDIECDIELPYMHENPWYDAANEFDLTWRSRMYNLTIEPITDIVSDEATESKPVYCTLWVSFPGLQVAGPSYQQDEDGSYTYMPCMTYDTQCKEYQAQGVDMPGLGTCKTPQGAQWGLNDIPASIYHLAKRYQPSMASKVRPWMSPKTYGKRTDATDKKVYVNDAPDYQYYASMFRFWRSSVNVIGKSTMIYDDIQPYGKSFREGNTNPDIIPYGNAYMLGSTNIVNARIPLRTGVSYLPTPTFGYKVTSVDTSPSPTTGNLQEFEVKGVEWSEPNNNTDYGTKVGSGGITTEKDSKAKFHLAAADDLTYKCFIGTPLVCPVEVVPWYERLNKSD